ncbi:S-adenosyl-L-methionine-dependent methyltransferase [Massariosphaeria phaeospora]|uniref:S-adenosyl-L-methionine-dependent methyltransferase n=1 Tax=Massariosphaeria phaeospora TaxID=100035 RepID=A0A7C8M779_9PLEO|nr:S-adenosyl-L-methionine-dependent methyltransferase [Massariosphaeria phaeospora]
MASSAANVAPVESNGSTAGKRYAETPLRKDEESRGSYRFKNKRMRNGHGGGGGSQILQTNGSNEEILLDDVNALLQKLKLERNEAAQPPTELPEKFSEIEVRIDEISSTGDGLGFQVNSPSDQVYVVPFTAPGDTVTAKVFKHLDKEKYSLADFVKVTTPSPHRDDALIGCPYFATCSGCQFQMLPYAYQLAHKKTIVEKAYRNFSNLPPELIPAIGDTIGSPLQYGYRTKLTPHFDGPPDARRSDGRNGIKRVFKDMPAIGFMKKGTRLTLDIEDCPIGTPAVRKGLARERKRVTSNLTQYHKGATLLLRESTERIPKASYSASQEVEAEPDADAIIEERGDYIYKKTCITDSNAKSTEYIDSLLLPKQQLHPPALHTIHPRAHPAAPVLPPSPTTTPPITHLIDAYSGSGLFTITLSTLFTTSLGIDISPSSITCAATNASLNALPPSSTRFLAADASALFAAISTPAAQTVVVIDPPRKGCDASFLRQLLLYAPARVVYVSCNVHTQARDVGVLVGGMPDVDGGWGVGKGCYEIERVTGFDFFPQTGHVEGVAVLRRKGDGGEKDGDGTAAEKEVEKEAEKEVEKEAEKEAEKAGG